MKKFLVFFGLLFTIVGLAGCSSVNIDDYCLVTVEGGTGGGNYKIGDIVEIQANTPSGQQFMYWSIDGEMISSNETYRFTVEKTVTLIANFDDFTARTVTSSINLVKGGV